VRWQKHFPAEAGISLRGLSRLLQHQLVVWLCGKKDQGHRSTLASVFMNVVACDLSWSDVAVAVKKRGFEVNFLLLYILYEWLCPSKKIMVKTKFSQTAWMELVENNQSVHYMDVHLLSPLPAC
jgi:hypothetical protein